MTCESKSYAQKLVQQSPLNPMQKVCYLHLGFHKTATTSFQLTLQKNRKQLKQAGIYLPKLRGKKQKFSANHSGQIRDVFAKKAQHLWDNTNRSKPPRDQQQQAIQNHYTNVKELLNQNHHILISGEGISTMPEQSLVRLKTILEQHDFLIKPFALVRPPYAFITSALQQTIKNGKYHPLIGLIPDQRSTSKRAFKIPSVSESISKLNRVFGERMNYVPFKTATSHPGGPVLFLLQEILELKRADQYQLINANESKSNVAIRLKNFLNQQHPHADQGKLAKLFKTISLHSEQTKFLLTQQEFDQIERDFKLVKCEMKRKLGKPFIEEKITFASEFSVQETNQLLSHLSQKLYEFAIEV